MGATGLIALGTFVAIVLLVAGPYYLLVVRPEVVAQDVLRQRIRTGGGGAAKARAVGAGLLKEVERLSAFGPLNRALGGDSPIAAKLRNAIARSGVKVTAGQIVTGSGCFALLAYVLMARWVPIVLLDAGAGLFAAVIPYLTLKVFASRRLSKFEEQFPEAIDLIARTLRAGHAFPTGLRMAADELPEPVASEFKLLHDQQNYGLPMPDALKAFAQRLPLIDARFFVTAVLTQREAGGNLAEVLDNLSAVIRERFKIKRQLRVISAHGRTTGFVLAMLPPSLAVFMFIRMPEHLGVLLHDPRGIRMITVAVGLQVLGAFLIHKITKVEY
jgi:tight adherence protein B